MKMSHQETMRKGPWLEEEDQQLVSFVSLFGERKWDFIASAAGLRRSGKSCRLRWLNYLRPNLKRGHISQEEEQIIIQLHQLWGNKWAKIARRLPGRTDNEIKNYWRTHLKKKLQPQQQGKNSKEELLGGFENKNNWWKFNSEDSKCKSNEEMNMGSNKSKNYYELSSLTHLMNSPYENILYENWISSSIDYHYQDEIMRSNDDLKACNCFEYCLCSCSFSFNGEDGDDGATILDSIGSLWDLT